MKNKELLDGLAAKLGMTIKDSNATLRSKKLVSISVDGKETHFTENELFNYLSGLLDRQVEVAN